MMSTRILPVLALLPFAACTDIEAGLDAPEPEVVVVTPAAAPATRPVSVSAPTAAPVPVIPAPAQPPAGALSPPPAAEGIAVGEPAPVSAPSPTGRLGTTVASLGTTEPGLWLETPLVSEPTSGRVEYQGQSVEVQLRPSGGEPGSGSQISLEAMRALGAPLTGLPELTVFGG